MNKCSIELAHMSKQIESQTFLFNDVNFTFEFGNFYLVKAKSGLGKTTLLTMLGGLEKATSGEIYFHGIDLKSKPFSYLFTDYSCFKNLTGYENLYLISKNRVKIEDITKELGINKILNKKVSCYSKGEYARLAIARIVLEDKPIILLDEPTGNLDETNQKNVLNLLKRISKNKLIICVSHDLTDNDVINIGIQEKKLVFQTGKIYENELEIKNRQKWFIPVTYFFRFYKQIIKEVPIKLLISFVLLSSIFLCLTISTSLIPSSKQIKNILDSNEITFAEINSDFKDAYYYYLYDSIPCLVSKNNTFSISGKEYSLNDNEIYLNSAYELYQNEKIHNKAFVSFEKYSLLSKNIILEDLIENGVDLDLSTFPLIEQMLKINFLNIFHYKFLFEVDDTLSKNEFKLRCSEKDYFDLNYSLHSLISNSISVEKKSILGNYTEQLTLKEISFLNSVQQYEVELIVSSHLLNEIEKDYLEFYQKVYTLKRVASNDFFDQISLFDISVQGFNEDIEIFKQMHTVMVWSNIFLILLTIIIFVFLVFLVAGIKRVLKNDLLLLRIIGFSKVNQWFLLSSSLYIMIFLGFLVGNLVFFFTENYFTSFFLSFYNLKEFKYGLFSYHPTIVNLLIFLSIASIIGYVYSRQEKNLNTILKENKI